MNKKLVLLLTFIVSFIVSIDVVWAAEKMTCTYDYDPRDKKTSGFDTITIEQNKKGDITVKINNSKTKNYNKSSLIDADNFMEKGALKKCPPCAQFTSGYKITLTNVGGDKKCADYNASFDNPVLAGRKTNDTKWVKECVYKNNSDKNKIIEIDLNKNNFVVSPNKNYKVSSSSNNITSSSNTPHPGFTLPELLKEGAVSNAIDCPKTIYVSKSATETGRITFKGCTGSTNCQTDKLTLYDSEKEKELNSENYEIKELDCPPYVNSGPYATIKYKLKQESNGVRKYYSSVDNGEYNDLKISKEDYSNASVYVEVKEKKVLDECPKCLRIDGETAIGSDESGTSENGNTNEYSCQTNSDLKMDVGASNGSGEGSSNEELACDSKWNMVCKYGYNDNRGEYLLLKFNEKEFSLYRTGKFIPSEQKMSEINIDKILQINNGKCPQNIYSFKNDNTNNGSIGGGTTYEEFYLNDAKNGDTKPAKANRVYTRTSSKDCSSDGSSGKKTGWVINNCQDLFGDDLIEIIDKVMGYIKILVPILLLVFGTTDFFTAIFSSDQEEMISKRKKFFKRLIAAIIVFIVPTFVNLVLKLSNSVWSNIHEETCIDESDY